MTELKDQRPSDIYEGPGLWEGCVVVPTVVLVASIPAIVVALTDAQSDGLRVGLTGIVTGLIAWVGLWELFSRLHPRFSQGSGEKVKWLAVVGGPPLLALAAGLLAR